MELFHMYQLPVLNIQVYDWKHESCLEKKAVLKWKPLVGKEEQLRSLKPIVIAKRSTDLNLTYRCVDFAGKNAGRRQRHNAHSAISRSNHEKILLRTHALLALFRNSQLA